MGTDPAELSIQLDILVAHRVKRFVSGGDSVLEIEFHPPETSPPELTPMLPPSERGKIEQPEHTPYHRLFGGQVPAFRSNGEA